MGALLHQLRLEVGSNVESISAYCKSVVGLCTDQGVEAGISDVPELDLQRVLQSEACAAGLDSGQLMIGHGQCDESAPPTSHPSSDVGAMMPNAIFIPGIKHAMDNCSKDIWASMSHKEVFIGQLRALETLLGPTPMREKIVSLFFTDPATDTDIRTATLLKSWSSGLASLRWHEVVNFCRELMRIRPGLRTRWNLQRFVKSMPKEMKVVEGRGAQGAATYKEADAAIMSDFFWCYCEVVLEISKVSDTLSHWAEMCWFHGHKCEAISCPYKGCRGSELAAGAHKFLLEDAKRHTNTVVFGIASAPLGRSQKDVLISDWHCAQARLQLEMEIKMSFWDQLPWKLLGLNVPKLSLARCVARQCQTMWSRMTTTQQRQAHPMTRRYLDPAWKGLV